MVLMILGGGGGGFHKKQRSKCINKSVYVYVICLHLTKSKY